MVQRLARAPLKAEIRVRVPLALPSLPIKKERRTAKPMASPSRKRKTWQEKLNSSKDLPKVVHLKGKALRKWRVKTLAIPSPREIFSLIRRVPRGKIATTSALQSAVAKKHSAEMGCPVTTGIFVWISAHASEELEAKHPGSGAPYWRIIKSDG